MQSSIPAPSRAATQARTNEVAQVVADRRESRLRLAFACLLTLCGMVGFFGVSWDIQWHSTLGRDTFFIPPHLMLYSSIGAAGLICLGFVLFETWRYYHHDPAVTSATTTRTLRLFHAPLGFMVAGFGALSAVTAAPLDDYWHQLYGLDVTIWAPFHVMGLIGAFIITLGVMYIYASEVNRAAQQSTQDGRQPRRLLGFSLPEIGLIVQANIVLGYCCIIALPGLQGQGAWNWGGLVIRSYGLFIAFFVPLLLIAALRASRHVGMATAIAVIATAIRFLIGVFVPWATDLLVSAQGPNVTPQSLSYIVAQVGIPAWIIGAGLLIDGVYLLAKRSQHFSWNWLWPAALGSVLAIAFLTPVEPLWRRQSGVYIGLYSNWVALAVTTLLAMLVAALAAMVGKGFGAALRATREVSDAQD